MKSEAPAVMLSTSSESKLNDVADGPLFLTRLPHLGRARRRRKRLKFGLTAFLVMLSGFGLAFNAFSIGRRIMRLVSETPYAGHESGQGSDEESTMLRNVGKEEGRLPPAAENGKKFLAEALAKLEAEKKEKGIGAPATAGARRALRELAAHLSGGTSTNILGQTVILKEATPFDESVTRRFGRRLKIAKFLGEGTFALVLEVKDEETGEVYALRVPFGVNEETSSSSAAEASAGEESEYETELLENDVEHQVLAEEKGLRAILGKMPADKAAARMGLAVPLATAQLDKLPNGLHSNGVFISSKVQLTERFVVHLEDFIDQVPTLPTDAKTYIAQRLLLQVLHLQERGFCHNDLKLDGCLMRADGSFLLGDLGSSSPAGVEIDSLVGTTPEYAEPEFFMNILKGERRAVPVISHAKGDMWSLGVIIYELFTKTLPYGLTEPANIDAAALGSYFGKLIEKDIAADMLIPEMTKARVPQRWQELLVKLLQVRRDKRISANEVAQEYADLWQ
ncbi:hypothetical protein, conserved [Eimeria tenella]|uniref:Protein kinase domain-containing protein n=1 Tax=Eimeria tenella TaxID=5802 RepID=U6KR89_EIMTE|nr:hypothetical protein, conserved [Eimeria tenella]CDJ38894.1 hypothetical protein, conserved [Eimeria tenella]|eukprot:XP_013229649.1 hypothetical protein, conserved [Eimeria tenella]